MLSGVRLGRSCSGHSREHDDGIIADRGESFKRHVAGALRIDCVQDELAGLAGVSNVTIAKSLASLRAEGLVESGYRQVTIHDVAALDKWIADRSGD